MFENRGRGKGRGDSQKVPLKGLFSDGVWHCNCAPRLPAQKFQTKNGGPNHGRWFYTCQLPQLRRCDFFLWDDDAKSREAATVLKNSRSERGVTYAPQTPSKPLPDAGQVYTPQTPHSVNDPRSQFPDISTPSTPSKPSSDPHSSTTFSNTQSATVDEAEPYDWPLSDDDELSKIASLIANADNNPMPPPETPRKAIKTDLCSSPSKRRHSDMEDGSTTAPEWPTPKSAERGSDIFTTPSTSGRGSALFPAGNAGLLSPAETPTPNRFKDISSLPGGKLQETSLVSSILQILQTAQATLPQTVRDAIVEICHKQAMFTHGVMKGRDVSRGIIASKNERIANLQAEIEGLRTEKESSRAVIRHLRREVEESRGRGKG